MWADETHLSHVYIFARNMDRNKNTCCQLHSATRWITSYFGYKITFKNVLLTNVNDFPQGDILHLLIYFDVEHDIKGKTCLSLQKNKSSHLCMFQLIRQLWIWLLKVLVTYFSNQSTIVARRLKCLVFFILETKSLSSLTICNHHFMADNSIL